MKYTEKLSHIRSTQPEVYQTYMYSFGSGAPQSYFSDFGSLFEDGAFRDYRLFMENMGHLSFGSYHVIGYNPSDRFMHLSHELPHYRAVFRMAPDAPGYDHLPLAADGGGGWFTIAPTGEVFHVDRGRRLANISPDLDSFLCDFVLDCSDLDVM